MKDVLFETAQGAEVMNVADRRVLDGLPSDFLSLPGGIYEASADEEAEPSWLCSPLAVVARFRSSSGKDWGRIVEIEDPDGRVQRISLFDKDLAAKPSSVRADLVSHGLQTHGSPKSREALTRLIREWRPAKVLTSTDKLGWADDACAAFVKADGGVLGKGEFHFVGNASHGAFVRAVVSGSAKEWRDNVASLCVGNPLMMVSVSLAFAGPLLEFLNEEGGGLHLRGSSSCGKTTIQRVATSVWLNPAQVGSWRATSNGIETVAKVFNSTLLSLDEIAEVGGRDLDEALYMLANGQGKVRANAHGGANARAVWRVAILSTGEISVADKLAEVGRRVMAGQNVRLIDLEADSGRYGAFDELHGFANGAEFSGRLRQVSALYHGNAGPAFVEKIIPNRKKISEHGRTIMDQFVNRCRQEFSFSDDGQTLRVARRLALIGYAGVLASKFGLTGWALDAPLGAARVALGLWLDGRKTVHHLVGSAAKERTRAYLVNNANGFSEPSSPGVAAMPSAHGWKDGGRFFISGETWHEIHGAEATQAARDLKMAGLLLPGDGNNLAQRAPRWIQGRPRVYVVRREIIADGAPDEVSAAI